MTEVYDKLERGEIDLSIDNIGIRKGHTFPKHLAQSTDEDQSKCSYC